MTAETRADGGGVGPRPLSMRESPAYDTIGRGYDRIRQPDPRLERAVWRALRDARTVVNAGAGTGSYEPPDRWVLALEPSELMIKQRAPTAAPVLQAPIEQLPLADETVDAAMAIFTVHHWSDVSAGVGQLLRVAKRRIVILTMDVEWLAQMWLVRDYLPALRTHHLHKFPSIRELCRLLPDPRVEPVLIPRDCRDGFMAAFWGRPDSYLDPAVRAATSPWHDLPGDVVARALNRLRADLASGRWERRYADLAGRRELDVGVRLITSELAAPSAAA